METIRQFELIAHQFIQANLGISLYNYHLMHNSRTNGKTMKIIEALKEKNRLIRKTLELQNRISAYNCIIEGNPRAYNPKKEMIELNKTVEELIELKTKITMANQPIQEKIYRLSELKTKIGFLKTIPTTEGKAPSSKGYYSQGETFVWESSIKANERDNLVLELESEIEIIQKDLDHHNFMTSI